MSSKIEALVRDNILRVQPYSSARSEFDGSAEIFLDANENANGSPAGRGVNRYPDPLQKKLKAWIAATNEIEPENIFVGNGSDEAIDLLFRVFCRPGIDNVIICPPTYGMYKVAAEINDTAVIEVPLNDEFQVKTRQIIETANARTKLILICSPNNPTGNLIHREDILAITRETSAIVVVDEAYIHFASENSLIDLTRRFENFVVLQTFSKAWGMAGLRVGYAIANKYIIELMNRVKPPYNVSCIAQRSVVGAFEKRSKIEYWIKETVAERERLNRVLSGFPFVKTVFPSEANFILIRFAEARSIFRFLIENRIVVRDRSQIKGCEGCLRITVGTRGENDRLIEALEEFAEMTRVKKVCGADKI